MATQTLYRAVGPGQLIAIADSQWQEFPPRLSHQPFFYAFCNAKYARLVAKDWNVKKSGAGFVMRFEVDEDFISQFPKRNARSDIYSEVWVPAAQLIQLNQHIVGSIHLMEYFLAEDEYVAEVHYA